jgi:hypothetical protein
MGLYKGQNIITSSYMLPRVDDNRWVNVSRKRMHKKRRTREKRGWRKRGKKHSKKIKKQGVQTISVKEAQVYPVFDSRDIQRKEIHCINEQSRQLRHEEVQKYIYLSIFLSLYPKILAIASEATPIGSAGSAPDDIYSWVLKQKRWKNNQKVPLLPSGARFL